MVFLLINTVANNPVLAHASSIGSIQRYKFPRKLWALSSDPASLAAKIPSGIISPKSGDLKDFDPIINQYRSQGRQADKSPLHRVNQQQQKGSHDGEQDNARKIRE